jgi:hypothetical protein
MSREKNTIERSAAPVVLESNALREASIESLKRGEIVAVLVINNMDGVTVGRDGYSVEVMPGCDYIVLAVSRRWPELGERIAVVKIAPSTEAENGMQAEPVAD